MNTDETKTAADQLAAAAIHDRSQPRCAEGAPEPLRPRCGGTKKDGQPCGMAPMASGFCFRHDPAISAEAKQAAVVKGGQAAGRAGALLAKMKAGAADLDVRLDTPQDCKRVVEALAKALLLGAVSARTATALNALVNTAVKINEVELELQLLEAIDREKAALGVRR